MYLDENTVSHPKTGANQKEVVMDKGPLNSWLSSLTSGLSPRKRLYDLGISKEVANTTMDFLEGSDDKEVVLEGISRVI
jgi:hypothetical protein